VPAAVVAGQVADTPPPGITAVALAELAGGTAAAMASPERWLRAAGRRLAAGFGGGPDRAAADQTGT
jgi:glycerate kinase